jgi:hypothetical protein
LVGMRNVRNQTYLLEGIELARPAKLAPLQN